MPTINQLNLYNFRLIKEQFLSPAEHFNLIVGPNGSGKTSILEAIYFLAHGKSFRTSHSKNIVHYDEEILSVYTSLTNSLSTDTLGIELLSSGRKRLKLNKEPQKSMALLTKMLPLQLIDAYSHQIFLSGPSVRRQYLNWGLFHMKQSFHSLWKSFNTVLHQRNAALKNQGPYDDISFWTKEFITQAEQIELMRCEYIEALIPCLLEILKQLLPSKTFEWDYSKGWTGRLDEHLKQLHYAESKVGYSLVGPQKADFSINYNNKPVKEFLSHGELKMVAYALKIAQALLLHTEDKKTIFLVDDLPSELDIISQTKVMNVLATLDTQVFISAIGEDQLSALLPTDSNVVTLNARDCDVVL